MVDHDCDYPSYGELINILNVAEVASEQKDSNGQSFAVIVTEMFSSKYPHIPINR